MGWSGFMTGERIDFPKWYLWGMPVHGYDDEWYAKREREIMLVFV
jgi:hypothetical protein